MTVDTIYLKLNRMTVNVIDHTDCNVSFTERNTLFDHGNNTEKAKNETIKLVVPRNIPIGARGGGGGGGS